MLLLVLLLGMLCIHFHHKKNAKKWNFPLFLSPLFIRFLSTNKKHKWRKIRKVVWREARKHFLLYPYSLRWQRRRRHVSLICLRCAFEYFFKVISISSSSFLFWLSSSYQHLDTNFPKCLISTEFIFGLLYVSREFLDHRNSRIMMDFFSVEGGNYKAWQHVDNYLW